MARRMIAAFAGLAAADSILAATGRDRLRWLTKPLLMPTLMVGRDRPVQCALALGGAIGFVALATKTELTLPLVGGIFVVEALSDIIQVGYYKATKRRIFLMAPIHHHFEKKGWPESRIVVRFWIVSFFCAIVGLLLTLKVR